MKRKPVTHGHELVAVGRISLLKAQRQIIACQGCRPSLSRSFGSVLSETLKPASPVTEYILGEPARCPNCSATVIENTLVRCSGEDASDDLKVFEPIWDETTVVLINETQLSEAQGYVSGCENCDAAAEINFDYIVDAVTGCDPTVTEYVLCRSAKCPRCRHEITEKTLVAARTDSEI